MDILFIGKCKKNPHHLSEQLEKHSRVIEKTSRGLYSFVCIFINIINIIF